MVKYSRLALFMIALAVWCSAQDKKCADVYSLESVKRALTAPTSFSPGWSEASMNRMGDRAAISVLKVLRADDLSNPDTAHRVLLLLKNAFAKPQIVETEEDRTPEVTNLLLGYLQHLSKDAALQAEIKATSDYIKVQTSQQQQSGRMPKK